MANSRSAALGPQGADCGRPLKGPNAGYFPNVVIVTHEGRRALFYDDLLCGKVVIVNFMSIEDDAVGSVTANLARLQQQLGDRLGRHVFMYSITVDPLHDTPQALSDFAERHGAHPGWLFLTGTPTNLAVLRDRFFAHGPGHSHEGGSVADCSMRMLRYGNEAVGLWGSVPSTVAPEAIAMRISWVEPRPQPSGPPIRGGPMPLDSASLRMDEVQ